MKTAEFKRYKYIDDKRTMYSVWLRLHDGEMEIFHGSIAEYRVHGWDRHIAQLIIDVTKLTLVLAKYEIIGDA